METIKNLIGNYLGFTAQIKALEELAKSEDRRIDALNFELHGLHDVYMAKFRDIEQRVHRANQLLDPIIYEQTVTDPRQQTIRFAYIGHSDMFLSRDPHMAEGQARSVDVQLATFRCGVEIDVQESKERAARRNIALATSIARKVSENVYDKIMSKYGYREHVAEGR